MRQPSAVELITTLDLARHPEGGWFRETYRSPEALAAQALPGRFGGDRACSTAILFLLEEGDRSHLHRIKSDEVWHFHAGSTLLIQVLHPDGRHETLRLGPEPAAGDSYQAVVPAGCWFGAEPLRGPFTLVGCTVAPGFDFADFELGGRDQLTALFPQHGELILRMALT